MDVLSQPLEQNWLATYRRLCITAIQWVRWPTLLWAAKALLNDHCNQSRIPLEQKQPVPVFGFRIFQKVRMSQNDHNKNQNDNITGHPLTSQYTDGCKKNLIRAYVATPQ